ncbi:MAG: methionine adenosyltransferase [Planctomycetota bacterium]|jgi:S-adenosylmethionine synthetase
MSYLFTSESVTRGHPDKLADTISDAILDAYLAQDAGARVACETFVTKGLCLIGGEVRSTAKVDAAAVAGRVIRETGYDDASCGYPAEDVAIMVMLGQQSPEIAQGVDRGDPEAQGAGDQGLMFGYACRDTAELMPLPIHLAHRLTLGLTDLREQGVRTYLRPDGKSQVTVEYGDDDRPRRIHTVVVSTQHAADVDQARIREDVKAHLFPLLPADLVDEDTILHVNPTGSFTIGGPKGDTGLTGRKIIVDTYGGSAAHGGGAFSGKDPSKVDRSACYMARYIAKNIVAAELADEVEVQLAYAIGVADPVSLRVRARRWNGDGAPNAVLEEAVRRVFRLTPRGIIEDLGLLKPIYERTAWGGHFGRPGFPWEATDRVEALREEVRAVTANS